MKSPHSHRVHSPFANAHDLCPGCSCSQSPQEWHTQVALPFVKIVGERCHSATSCPLLPKHCFVLIQIVVFVFAFRYERGVGRVSASPQNGSSQTTLHAHAVLTSTLCCAVQDPLRRAPAAACAGKPRTLHITFDCLSSCCRSCVNTFGACSCRSQYEGVSRMSTSLRRRHRDRVVRRGSTCCTPRSHCQCQSLCTL